jgi:RNA polymerase sigma-70 factor, ECF subfamily
MDTQIDQPVHAPMPGSMAVNLSDRKIIDRILVGDKHHFELLVRRYNRRMFRLVRSIIKDATEAEDVIQETYILAYLNLRSFKGNDSAASWLARIAINEALSRLRCKRNHRIKQAADPEEGFTAYGPEQFVRTYQTLWLIESAIDDLPCDYRMVFILRAVEQLSVDETAEYLKIKPATVKTRLHRAKAILQRRMGRKLDELLVDAFPFGGLQCDRVVARLREAFVNQKLTPLAASSV